MLKSFHNIKKLDKSIDQIKTGNPNRLKLLEQLGFLVVPYSFYREFLGIDINTLAPNRSKSELAILKGEAKRKLFEEKKINEITNTKEKNLRMRVYKTFLEMYKEHSVTEFLDKSSKDLMKHINKREKKQYVARNKSRYL